MASLEDLKNENVDLVSPQPPSLLLPHDAISSNNVLILHCVFVCVRLQESIPIQEVFAVLKSSPHGLTSNDGASRLQIFGPNKLEEKKVRCLIDNPAVDLPQLIRDDPSSTLELMKKK